MNFFLMKRLIAEIKSGKPIMYHNIEMTSEEVEKRFLNTFHKKEKSILSDRVLKYCGYKIKNGKLVQTKYEPDPNKRSK